MFRIWSNGSNFGAGTLRSVNLHGWGAATQDALMIPSHIISAAVCHWLHSLASNCNRQWLRSETTFTPSFKALQNLSLHPSVCQRSPTLLPALESVVLKYLFLSNKGSPAALQVLWVNIWVLFTIATSV